MVHLSKYDFMKVPMTISWKHISVYQTLLLHTGYQTSLDITTLMEYWCKCPTHGWTSKLLGSRCSSLPITIVQQHKTFNSHSQLQHCHWAFFTSNSPILCPALIHPLSFTLLIDNIVKSLLLIASVHNYKPDKVQNGVGPISRLVSVSIKCSEEQYSDVLSIYVIRTSIAEKRQKKTTCFNKLYICYIVQFTITIVELSIMKFDILVSNGQASIIHWGMYVH